MQKDKIESLLGFGLRAGKVKFGADATESGKRSYLTIVCKTLADNSLRRVLKNCEAKRVPVLESERPLEQIVHKTNCKVVSVTDRQMSAAMLKEINENYRLLVTGGNGIDNDQ